MWLRTIEKLILSELPKDGSPEGNVSLIKRLSQNGMTEKEYWTGQKSLLEKGVVLSGKGRGGSIRLVIGSNSIDTEKENETNERQSIEVRDLIMKLVPRDGNNIGNRAFIDKLSKQGVSEDQYWAERNALIDEGKLAKGRGYGGSVYLPKEVSKVSPATKAPSKYKSEQSLYSPFYNYITGFWMKDNNLKEKQSIHEITANQGKRRTGGKWTRPDVTVITVKNYQFVPGKQLEVITFEVKPADDLDIRGVYETAAHSRFAHKSYLAVYLPDVESTFDEKFVRLREECTRFGLGLIYFGDPENLDTYEVEVDPKRNNPDPDEIDKFIKTQINKKNQEDIQSLIF